jgi:hypothetical protein
VAGQLPGLDLRGPGLDQQVDRALEAAHPQRAGRDPDVVERRQVVDLERAGDDLGSDGQLRVDPHVQVEQLAGVLQAGGEVAPAPAREQHERAVGGHQLGLAGDVQDGAVAPHGVLPVHGHRGDAGVAHDDHPARGGPHLHPGDLLRRDRAGRPARGRTGTPSAGSCGTGPGGTGSRRRRPRSTGRRGHRRLDGVIRRAGLRGLGTGGRAGLLVLDPVEQDGGPGGVEPAVGHLLEDLAHAEGVHAPMVAPILSKRQDDFTD